MKRDLHIQQANLFIFCHFEFLNKKIFHKNKCVWIILKNRGCNQTRGKIFDSFVDGCVIYVWIKHYIGFSYKKKCWKKYLKIKMTCLLYNKKLKIHSFKSLKENKFILSGTVINKERTERSTCINSSATNFFYFYFLKDQWMLE